MAMDPCPHIHPSCMEGRYIIFMRSGLEDFSFSFNTFYVALLLNSVTLCRLPPTSTLEILVPANVVGKVMV